MNNKEKGFVVPIIIAILVLITIGGVVYFTNTEQEEIAENNLEKNIIENDIEESIDSDIIQSDDVSDESGIEDANTADYLQNNQEENQDDATSNYPEDDGIIFCTMDAFQCPDGTWVGRTGPNCEFVCPDNNTVTLHTVNIKSYYTKPEIVSDKEIIYITGNESRKDYIKINITGEINNFKHVEVRYDRQSDSFIETETLFEIPNVLNKYILINTVLPGAIPLEKISWESVGGKKYEVLLGESGITGEINQEFILE